MKFRVKLPLVFAISLALLLAGGVFGIFELNLVVARYETDVLRQVAGHKKGSEVSALFSNAVQEWKNVLLRGKNPQELERYWLAHQTAMKEARLQLANLDKQMEASLPAHKQVAQLDAELQKLQTAYQSAFDAFSASGFNASAGDNAVKGKDRTAMANLADLLATLSKTELAASEAAARQAMLSTRISIAVMLLVTVLSIVAGVLITRQIVKPLQDAVSMAGKVASGDLTSVISVHGHDEIAALNQSLQTMQRCLIDLVTQVRNGSQSLAGASSEIAQGNLDLSIRTEQQASALQETASNMESLSKTVTHNAENALQARDLANQASDVATQGGIVVNQVIDTMKAIQDSSQKITDIIGVIDGIAFQTNILALNAAVEAARAGEQGRGFAVVATEVRALAGRSAAAAKEIKMLIDASVSRVGAGTELVDRAGNTMAQVVTSIRRVSDMVGAISFASSSQSVGVAQAGAAVSQIDQVTQQNAALVEQMTAAASGLKQQAIDLVQLVAVFKFDPAETSINRLGQTTLGLRNI